MTPRHAMKPQQKFFGAGVYVIKLLPQGSVILTDGVTAGATAIKAEPFRIRAMKIHVVPVRAFCAIEFWVGSVVMMFPHNVMQAKWSHIVDAGFPGAKHHRLDRVQDKRIVRPGHSNPFVGNRLRAQSVIPGETTEGVPVRLCKVMPAPVAIRASTGDADNARGGVTVQLAIHNFGNRRTGFFGVCVGIQNFLPHPTEVNQVNGLTEIFLCDLQL
jgi:hypothetical protein